MGQDGTTQAGSLRMPVRREERRVRGPGLPTRPGVCPGRPPALTRRRWLDGAAARAHCTPSLDVLAPLSST